MEKTIFEQMGGTYEQQGDYLIPCLKLPAEKEERYIGVWGNVPTDHDTNAPSLHPRCTLNAP